jgi:restriction system protein
MALPSFQHLMLPVLRSACERSDDISIADLENELALGANIDAADLARLLPSGKKGVFANRVAWARSYLCKVGLLETRRKGYVQATERGRALMAEGVTAIDQLVLARYPEFAPADLAAGAASAGAPQKSEDQIVASYHRLNAELASEIVSRIHALKPEFFERLIVDLLVKMGYGGGRLEMGRTLGRTGDGGVDGVIKEDELGLDVIYVQAKRFAQENSVPLREVRDFVGGLEGHRATKGVFVTTSYFPSTAYEFITRVTKRVVLIDGPELASLMIRHHVGVRMKATYELKKIDEDYFVD